MDKTSEETLACLEASVESKHLDYLRPLFQDWDPAIRLSALQAVVACYTMEVWNDPLLFGLPTCGQDVLKASETMRAMLSPPAYSNWRASTLEALKQSADIKISVDAEAMALTDKISAVLTSLVGVEESTAPRSCPLHAIIKRFVSLSHVFRVQRAEYEFILPEPGLPFNPANMEATSSTGDEITNPIRCATFPLVLKGGDVPGISTPSPNVVVKAKVLCLP